MFGENQCLEFTVPVNVLFMTPYHFVSLPRQFRSNPIDASVVSFLKQLRVSTVQYTQTAHELLAQSGERSE